MVGCEKKEQDSNQITIRHILIPASERLRLNEQKRRTFDDDCELGRGLASDLDGLHLSQHEHTIDDLSEDLILILSSGWCQTLTEKTDDMFTVQVGRCFEGDEELASVLVRPGILSSFQPFPSLRRSLTHSIICVS